MNITGLVGEYSITHCSWELRTGLWNSAVRIGEQEWSEKGRNVISGYWEALEEERVWSVPSRMNKTNVHRLGLHR